MFSQNELGLRMMMLIWSALDSCVWKCKWQKKIPESQQPGRNVDKKAQDAVVWPLVVTKPLSTSLTSPPSPPSPPSPLSTSLTSPSSQTET